MSISYLHASRDGVAKPPRPRKQRVDIKMEVLPVEDVPMEDASSLVADPYLILCVVRAESHELLLSCEDEPEMPALVNKTKRCCLV